MKKIESFDRQTCRLVGERAEAALAAVAEEFGLTTEPQGGRFDAATYTFKIVFKATSDGGQPADYERNAEFLGLPKDSWGKMFTDPRGHRVKIVGLDPRKPKYPVVCEGLDGRQVRYMASQVTRGLTLAAAS